MNFIDYLTGAATGLISAIIYLLIAFLVAWIVKRLVVKILDKVGAKEALAKSGMKEEETDSAIGLLGNLAFLIVFLLFLPAVLVKLGMENVAAPITSAISSIIGFLPNLLAAGIILFVGIYVAKVVRQLLHAVLNKLGLDKLQKKLGVEAKSENSTFAGVISGIVYVLILIPVIVAAIEVLGIDAISGPAMAILSTIFGYIPNVLAAIILFVLGYQISKILAQVLESVLSSVGADKLTEKLNLSGEEKGIKVSFSKIISEVVRWLILIVFFIEAVNLLKLEVLTSIGAAIVGYLPNLLGAIIIIGLGVLLASWLESIIVKHAPKRKTLGLITKVIIIVFAVFMTLSQLGLAKSIVNAAFIIILAAVAVAFAISFGIGGRDFAKNRLYKLEEKLDEESSANEE